jgi:hypothetical protein
VTLVATRRPGKLVLTSTEVAPLLRISRRALLRVPKDHLDYSLTPGGGERQHRRYRREDVERYALDFLGLHLDEDDNHDEHDGGT